MKTVRTMFTDLNEMLVLVRSKKGISKALHLRHVTLAPALRAGANHSDRPLDATPLCRIFASN